MSLRSILDSTEKRFFRKGAKLERLYPVFEALDTILYSTGKAAKGASHVRDGLDLKRMMMAVVLALIPAIFMAMYNTGLQAHRAIANGAPAARRTGRRPPWRRLVWASIRPTSSRASSTAHSTICRFCW